MLKLIRNFNRNIHENIRENRRVFLLYTVLRVLVIVALVRAIMNGNYNGAFICLLSLGLFLVPSLLEQGFKIHIPPLLEGTIYLFIFSAEILGELNHFYAAIPQWDTILHTLNGFLAAAVGFSMIDLLNRNSRHFQLSPFYLVMVATKKRPSFSISCQAANRTPPSMTTTPSQKTTASPMASTKTASQNKITGHSALMRAEWPAFFACILVDSHNYCDAQLVPMR